MTTQFHDVIATGAAANASVFNAPLSQLDTAIGNLGGGADATSDYIYATWPAALSRFAGVPTYDGPYTDVVSTLAIVWPDGSAGTYTATAIDSVWLEATAFTLTHADSGLTLTGTGLVRNAAGQITTKMTLSVA